MKQNNMITGFMKLFFLPLALIWLGGQHAHAQEVENAATAAQSPIFEVQARAADSTTLMAGRTPFHLWGIEPLGAVDGAMKLRARTSLDNAIAGQKVKCETKDQQDGIIYAQCVNARDQDLSLTMIQQGYATVDRKAVLGTVFEQAYVQAEAQAQNNADGIWAASSGAGGGVDNSPLIIGMGFVLLLSILGVAAFLAMMIRNGFERVTDMQKTSMKMMDRETELRKKEREVVAVMIDSELKTNKAKIEAYIAVYEEVLRGLGDQNKTPKYKTAGDIIQQQPALNRAVFDSNTDKMDVLGGDLSSALIHFYAQIKTEAEYTNLEPEMDVAEAKRIVHDVLRNAKKLNEQADGLLESLIETGLTKN